MELSSETFPTVKDFGGDNFLGDGVVFLGERGGNGGMGGETSCGDRKVRPPSKSLSQSSSSVFGLGLERFIKSRKFEPRRWRGEMGVGFRICAAAAGEVRFVAGIGCFGAGRSVLFPSNAKNSSQLLSTIC